MGVFRHLRTATKGFALGTHFLFFREAKGSEKKLKRAARLELWKQTASLYSAKSSFFMDSEIRFFATSTSMTATCTTSPTDRTSLGCFR